VAGAGDGHEVEGLPGFLQRGDDLRRAGGIDVRVEFADDEEEVSLELVGVFLVAAFDVLSSTGQPIHCSFHQILSMRLS
jgi:hypothetical protein